MKGKSWLLWGVTDPWKPAAWCWVRQGFLRMYCFRRDLKDNYEPASGFLMFPGIRIAWRAVKMQIAGLYSQSFWFSKSGWGLKICISTGFCCWPADYTLRTTTLDKRVGKQFPIQFMHNFGSFFFFEALTYRYFPMLLSTLKKVSF